MRDSRPSTGGALAPPVRPKPDAARFHGDSDMAKSCDICGKGPTFGRQISHAHNVSSRRFLPNIQRVRALLNGQVKRINTCTRCLRSGKVVKAPARPKAAAH